MTNEKKDQIMKAIEDRLYEISSLQSVLVSEECQAEPETEEEVEESAAVSTYLDAPANSKKETEMKQIFAAATAASMSEEEAEEESPLQLASSADEGLTRTKLAYMVAAGDITPMEAVDAMIDHAAAKTSAFVPEFVAEKLEQVVNAGCTVIEAAFPPARMVTPYIRTVVKVVKKPVANAIRAAIPKVAEAAKTVVHKAANWVAEKATKIGRKINKFLGIFS